MSKLLALAVCLVVTTAFAADPNPAPEDAAVKYVNSFIKGDVKPLLDHASPQLKQLMKDENSVRKLRTDSVGDQAKPVSATYSRTMKAANGQMWTITATVTPSGELAGFLVTPAKDQ
jgi:hypothetical protein